MKTDILEQMVEREGGFEGEAKGDAMKLSNEIQELVTLVKQDNLPIARDTP